MAQFQAGEVVVPVVPDAGGFQRTLRRELVPGAARIGEEIGRDIGRGIQRGIGSARVELSTAEAMTQLRALQAAAREATRDVTISAQADTQAAAARLAELGQHADRVDGRRAELRADVDTGRAAAELAALDAALSRVDGQTARARVDVDISGALGAIGTITAAMGALAAAPALATIGAGVAGLAGGFAAAAAGAGAFAAIAAPSLSRVSEAMKEQNKAAREASDAVVSGAQRAAQAAQSAYALEQAERRIVDAKKAAKDAEQALTQAREDARRAIEDLRRSVEDAALAEEDAALSVEEARRRLAEVMADPEADDLARRRAELAVRQAEARHRDAVRRSQELQAEERAAAKAGVEGSEQVRQAKERLAEAEQRVRDAQTQLKLLQLQQAAASQQQARATGGVADQMSGLTPAARAAAVQIRSFAAAYSAWQEQLEPAVLPAVTGGLKVLQQLFKPLTPLVQGTAGALVELEKSAGRALGGGFWQGFFRDLSDQAPAAVTGLGKSLGNVATGIAGIIRAFLPFTGTIVGGVEKATAAFARWGQSLGRSEGFQSFIGYVRQHTPAVLELFRNLWTLGKNVVVALAPLGGPALAGLTGLTGLLAQIPPDVLTSIAAGIASIAGGIKAWTAAQGILNTVLKAGPFGTIITLLGLLAAGITYAWQNSETFRTVVTTVWDAVSSAIQWAWESAIQPAVQALVDFWQNVLAPAATWLWENVIQPAWDGISAAIQWAWNSVIQPALKAAHDFVKNVLGPVFSWLWSNVIKPAWDGISSAIRTAWNNYIQPALKAAHEFVKNVLGPVFSWLWNEVIVPAWNGIKDTISSVWEKYVKPVFDTLQDVIKNKIPDAFEKGKDAIGRAWDKVKEVAKTPVNFVIDFVYNKGIVRVWNAVVDALGLDDLRLQTIPTLARGGVIPGYTPGRDITLAAVSGGEAIMRPEWTRAVGEDYVNRMNAAARRGGVAGVARALGIAGDPAGFAGAFADGGIVGNIRETLAGGLRLGAEKLLNPLVEQAAATLGGSAWGRMIATVPSRLVDEMIKWIAGKEGNASAAVAFARAQIGKPYQWGGTGPDAFDCSGLVMRAWQAAGITDIPRTSQQQMAWVKPVKTPLPGDLGFPHPGHVWIYSGPNTIIEAPYTGAYVREVAARAAQVIGRPPQLFDDGGWLPPGTSLVFNGTGRPEPVLTDQQWQALQSRPGGPLVNIEGDFVAEDGQSPYAIAQELSYLMAARLRMR